jgi:prophage regulatory protein
MISHHSPPRPAPRRVFRFCTSNTAKHPAPFGDLAARRFRAAKSRVCTSSVNATTYSDENAGINNQQHLAAFIQAQKESSKMVRTALRLPDVMRATGLSKASVYVKIAEGKFPKPVKPDPSGKIVIWFDDQISDWQDSVRAAAKASEAA